jgi:hypothetical protein
MTEEQIKESLKTLNEQSPIFANLFDADGKLNSATLEYLAETETKGLTQNMSADLMLNRKSIEEDIKEVSANNNMQIELSTANIGGEERRNLAKIYKATKLIGNKAGKPLKVVVVKSNDRVNGFISKNGIMYIDETRLKDGMWAKTTAHEITHFVENSDDYKAFAKFMLEDGEAIKTAKNNILKAGYNFTNKEIDNALEKINKGEKLNGKETEIYNEVVAHITEDLIGNEETINRLARNNEGLARKILNRIKDFIRAFKETNADGEVIKKLEKAQTLFENALKNVGDTNNSKNKYSYSSINKKITIGMSDSERYVILKDKSAKVPFYDGSKNEIIDKETSNLKNSQKELIEATMRRLALEFGLFEGNKVEKYNVEDFDIAITLSKRTLDESAHKIITNAKQLAKLLPVLKQVAEGAIGIESHINRYYFDNTTREFYELVGGYIEGEYFVPVRLGVKAFVDNTYGLYVVVCQDKIKKTKVIASKGLDKSNAPDARLVNINLPQLFNNVNTIDILRYIPDDFLTISQRELKYQGIAETIKYTDGINAKIFTAIFVFCSFP